MLFTTSLRKLAFEYEVLTDFIKASATSFLVATPEGRGTLDSNGYTTN
jgi:hypothetical protein